MTFPCRTVLCSAPLESLTLSPLSQKLR
jgi:hypothetical protein